jgi:hypothetical protein
METIYIIDRWEALPHHFSRGTLLVLMALGYSTG